LEFLNRLVYQAKAELGNTFFLCVKFIFKLH
jgi:hypothetical protein